MSNQMPNVIQRALQALRPDPERRQAVVFLAGTVLLIVGTMYSIAILFSSANPWAGLVAAGAGLLMLLVYNKDVSDVAFGKDGVTATMRDMKESQAALVRALRDGIGGPVAKVSGSLAADAKKRKIINEDDPQKGRWGGISTNEGYRLDAWVKRVPGNTDWFTVTIEIKAEPGVAPFTESALHLHDTFPKKTISLKPGSDGKAVYELEAWGAFTVGAQVLSPNGIVPLELDLADLESAPRAFRNR